MPKTHVALVLDRSGSMRPIESAVVRCYNDILASLRRESRRTKQDTRVTFVSFADRPEVHYRDAPLSVLRDYDEREYTPDGMTALYAATERAARELPALLPGDAALCVVITDGDETVDPGGVEAFQDAIAVRLATDQWTFAFHVPRGKARRLVSLGVPAGCVHEWEATEEGTRDVSRVTTQSLAGYYSLRSLGGTRSAKIFNGDKE